MAIPANLDLENSRRAYWLATVTTGGNLSNQDLWQAFLQTKTGLSNMSNNDMENAYWASLAKNYTADRTNLCTNPSSEVNVNNYATNPGTGGVVTTSRPNDGGYVGSSYYRATWTTANTASGYLEYSGLSGQSGPQIIYPGKYYAASSFIRSSVAINCYLTMNWWNGSSSTGSINSSPVALPANTWTRVGNVALAPAGSIGVWLDWYSTTPQALNQTMDIDAVLIEQALSIGPYFDGNTAVSGKIGSVWTGVSGGSTSIQGVAGDTLESKRLLFQNNNFSELQWLRAQP